jgi:hypothetical protein
MLVLRERHTGRLTELVRILKLVLVLWLANHV